VGVKLMDVACISWHCQFIA